MLPTDNDTRKLEKKEKSETEDKIEEKLNDIKEKMNVEEEEKIEENKELIENKKKEDKNNDNKISEKEKVEEKVIIKNEETISKDVKKEESPFLFTASNETLQTKLDASTVSEAISIDKENTIFQSDCNLFRYVPGKPTLEARGVGKIFITRVVESNLYKLVMNRDKINRLGCNHYISPIEELKDHSTVSNLCIWHTSTDTCEKDAKLNPNQTFALRIKEDEDFKMFKEKYDFAREHNGKEIEKNKFD
ncbi:E3 SUMO-protein ligase RanBP2 [Gurleya vavrai]